MIQFLAAALQLLIAHSVMGRQFDRRRSGTGPKVYTARLGERLRRNSVAVLEALAAPTLDEILDGARGDASDERPAASRVQVGRAFDGSASAHDGCATRQNGDMELVPLGKSGLKVSEIVLGCMSFGESGRGTHEWTLPEEDALPF